MASRTRVTNVGDSEFGFPAPYSGVLAPGAGAILAGTPETVIANLGGLKSVGSFLKFDKADTSPLSPQNSSPAALAEHAAEVLGAAGPISPTIRTTKVTSTGLAQPMTLANGEIAGDRKSIVMSIGGGGFTTKISPLSFFDGSFITLTLKLDSVELEWDGMFWFVVNLGQTATVT